MTVTKLMDGLHIIPGLVNTYLLETPGGLTLIDTGFPRDTAKIISGIASIGRRPRDVSHILLTHAHPDHIGGAAALREATGAQVHAHRIDAPVVETGGPFRPLTSAPGLRNRIVVSILRHVMKRVAPCRVDHHLKDGVALPFDPDLVPIHIPDTAPAKSPSIGVAMAAFCSSPMPASIGRTWFSPQRRKMWPKRGGAWRSSRVSPSYPPASGTARRS